jgi:hypothetical protein
MAGKITISISVNHEAVIHSANYAVILFERGVGEKFFYHCYAEEGELKRIALPILLVAAGLLASTCSSRPTTAERLRAMRTGVWISNGGGYTVWTGSHYFVVSAKGEGQSTNIYCGASQVRYTDRGIARKQNLRLRQLGAEAPAISLDYSMFKEGAGSTVEETPLEIDETLFKPGQCVIEGGVIYDSIAEETDEYILLSSCNGDQVKIYMDGRSVYMPAGGGEAWSYRIETW